MAMFDKHKSSKQPTRAEEEPTRAAPPSPAPSAPAPGTTQKAALVGEGISINGDVNASTNLKVEGRIEGRAVTSSQDVEVSETGIVKASITARVVRISGAVAGDINGSEKVMISKSGRVQGNIVAPRVQLDDGALFRGSIDMNPAEPAKANTKPADAPKASPAPATGSKPAPAGKPAQPESGKEPGLTLKSG